MLSTEPLKAQASALGFDLCGVCAAQEPPHWSAYKNWLDKDRGASMVYLRRHLEAKKDPRSLLPSCQSIIAVGLNYNQPNPIGASRPHIARYALGRDYHKVIRGKLRQLGDWLAHEHAEVEHRICVDSAPLMERDFAQLAGLGWFGKNTMLINSQRGSWFLLGFLLTNLSFASDETAIGGCGTCRACIDACPTGAIVHEDGRWQVDARRCISYLTIEHRGEIEPELQEKMGGWTFGCDICQEVCPFNHPRSSQPLRAAQTQELDFLAQREWPGLQELRVIAPQEWDRLTQGSPVRRTGIEGLRRNAAINLINKGS